MTERIRIRCIVGEMPFDQNGRHATGREVWDQAAAGNWCWLPEFEGDDTEDLPVTETAHEHLERYIETRCTE